MPPRTKSLSCREWAVSIWRNATVLRRPLSQNIYEGEAEATLRAGPEGHGGLREETA